MGSGNAETDDDQGEDLGNEGDDADVEILSESGSQPLLRLSPDGQRQVRPRVYTPQTDPKGLFYRVMDDDAEPPRSDVDLNKLLPADAELSDVRPDVLEHWRMDSDKQKNVILGETAEDIVVHASLRRDVLCAIIRRLLCLRSLDEVDWLMHVSEEYFERAYKRAEDSNWVIGVEHPWPPVPTEPREPSESSYYSSTRQTTSPYWGPRPRRLEGSPPDGPPPGGAFRCFFERVRPPNTADAISWLVNDVQVHQASQSGKHQIRGFPDYDVVPTSAAEVKSRLVISDYLDLVDGTAPGEDAPWDTVFQNRHVVFWFACREVTEEHPAGFSDDFLVVASEHVLVTFNFRRAQWERDHWVVLDRTDEAQKKVYSERATRQRSWYKALLKLRAKVALLPAREPKWFRCEPGLWRRPRLPVTWVPLPRGDNTPSLRDQLQNLDRREPPAFIRVSRRGVALVGERVPST
ncbi:hypothetical protein PHMEG_00022524 [Phytophthora megakarya]|uniref:Uncharacterized protein n=1 Tax=Phytophthora megakarya TaxID=4795 RepID=A0A225VIG8_9STRA|nr:hypothetical protein PHMEG_00022524 [Phytophthora megakarya]